MLDIIIAVAPIFGLILFGCVLRRMDFPGPGFWPVSERLTYYVLFPAMLMHGLSGRQIQAGGFPIAGAIAGSVVLVFLGLRWLRPRLGMSGPAYTSVLQGSIRPNTYVAMSVAAGLLGPDWMALSAVALLTIIPLVNVLCVLALARHGNNAGGGLLKVLKELARNPLILSCVVGLAMNWGGWSLPPVVDNLFAILGTAALPMGLLAVGAGFRFDGVMDGVRGLAVSSAAHLVALPVLAAIIARGLAGDVLAVRTAVIYTAIPVAVSAFILARQMGGDHRLMAQIITFQTLLSAATLPVALTVLA